MAHLPASTQKPSLRPLIAAFMLWLLFAQAVRGAVISSLASDEGPHLAVGYATLRTGDLRLQPVHIHPPLINVLAGAPLLLDPSLPDPRSLSGWSISSLSMVTDTVIWQHRPPDGLALAGRLPIIFLAMLLGAFVCRWAADLNRKAGLGALFLYVLDPNIVAHAQVITTDMGVTLLGFIAWYCCFKASEVGKSNLKWTVGVGVALGTALTAKVSAALLAPLLAVAVLLIGRESISRRVRRIVLIGLVAFGVVWAVYGFQVGYIPGVPVPVPAPTHWRIYQSLLQHYDEGHPAFLMGMNSTRGWWYYFPVAFLVKTPLPTLALLVIACVTSLRPLPANRQRPVASAQWNTVWTLGLFPIVHFVTALFSSVDIGYRHLLPILPFLFVFIAIQVSNLLHRLVIPRKRVLGLLPGLVVVVLLIWYTIGAATIFPYNLTFFNELVGGPDGGYRWLVDSNLDWGQNLKELKTWLSERGIQNVFISQFSPSRPAVYGLQATMLPPSPRAAPFAHLDPAPGWYAIGATTLQGTYTPDVDTFAYFRTVTPTARIGHALFVYHVPEQPRGEWLAQCASPSPPLDTGEIETGFGRTDLRVVQFDCLTSWWYPAQAEPGWYAGAPGRSLDVQVWYPSGRLVYEPRSNQVSGIYFVDSARPPRDRRTQATAAPGDWLPAQVLSQGTQVTAPAPTTGPLQFEGFWLYQNKQTERPGGEALVLTAWRVMRGADTPLSIMAHLLDAQGRVVSGADGLGVPIETWQAGDVIVQAHWLNVPSDVAPGTYWIETGVYRLDTLERYRILQEGQPVGDRLLLTAIEVTP